MQHLHDVFPAQSVTVTQTFAHIFWHCFLCPITEHATAARGDFGGRWSSAGGSGHTGAAKLAPATITAMAAHHTAVAVAMVMAG